MIISSKMKKNIYTKYKRKFVPHSYERRLKFTEVIFFDVQRKLTMLVVEHVSATIFKRKNAKPD
ncbi:hypothetical protein T10_4329 [Trichinella papuae]|uniref:Uncharacterized protein n=1 Tax=Trichinella papuae TaxID=268474 RepID=A0A0V1N9A4_9BILA|nr:hypothetical protein T10_4329 [Trichinella papuae]